MAARVSTPYPNYTRGLARAGLSAFGVEPPDLSMDAPLPARFYDTQGHYRPSSSPAEQANPVYQNLWEAQSLSFPKIVSADPSFVPQATGGYATPNIIDVSDQVHVAGAGKPLQSVQGLVIHHTAGGGGINGVISTFNQRGYPAQFVIDRNGQIYQTLPTGGEGFQIAKSDNTGLNNANTIGVEIIGANDSDILPTQVQSAQQLYQYLSSDPAAAGWGATGLKADQVFGHGVLNVGQRPATEGLTVANAIRQNFGGTPYDPKAFIKDPDPFEVAALKQAQAAAPVNKPASPAQIAYSILTQGDPAHGIAPLSPAVAAGAVGNMMQESGMNPAVIGKAGEIGIGQWLGPRYTNMINWNEANGLDPSSLQGQALFYSHELQTSPTMAKLASVQTPGDAAKIIATDFERPGTPMMDKRIGYANEVAQTALSGPAAPSGQAPIAADVQPDFMVGDTPAWANADWADTANAVPTTTAAPVAAVADATPVAASPEVHTVSVPAAKVVKTGYNGDVAPVVKASYVKATPASLVSPAAIAPVKPAAAAPVQSVDIARPSPVKTGNALGDRMLNAILTQNPLELAAIGNDYKTGNAVTFGAPGTQMAHGLLAVNAVKSYLDAHPDVASQVKGILQSDMTPALQAQMAPMVGDLPGKATPPQMPFATMASVDTPPPLPTPRPAHTSDTSGGAWDSKTPTDISYSPDGGTFLGGGGYDSFLSPPKPSSSGVSAWGAGLSAPSISSPPPVPATPYPTLSGALASGAGFGAGPPTGGTPADLGKSLSGLSLGGFGAMPPPSPDADPVSSVAETIPTIAGTGVSFSPSVQPASLTGHVLAAPKSQYPMVQKAQTGAAMTRGQSPGGANAGLFGLPSLASVARAASSAGYTTGVGSPGYLSNPTVAQALASGYHPPDFQYNSSTGTGSGGAIYAYHPNGQGGGTYITSNGTVMNY